MEYEDSIDTLAYITRLEAQRDELIEALQCMTNCARALANQHGSTILNNRIDQASDLLRAIRSVERCGL